MFVMTINVYNHIINYEFLNGLKNEMHTLAGLLEIEENSLQISLISN